MFIDLELAGGDVAIDADLCVIGAGAAGITIAREFAESSTKVCVLESGGSELELETQDLCAGRNIGHPYMDLDIARFRLFGGSTSFWGGACGWLSKIAFEERPWVPHSGWPISKEDLDQFQQRAARFLQLGAPLFDERVWGELGIEPLALDGTKLHDCFYQFSRDFWGPLYIGKRERDRFEKSANVQVVLHANVVNIQSSENAAVVERVDARTLRGIECTVKARVYVLACGGIDNARILLYSDNVEPHGLGNRYDLVGRFFMNHPNAHCATLARQGIGDFVGRYTKQGAADGTWYQGYLCLADGIQGRERVLNAAARMVYSTTPDSGMTAARRLWHKLRKGEVPDDLGTMLWRIARDIDEVAYNAYRQFVEKKAAVPSVGSVYLVSETEQAPNPNSRVVLSRQRDALGLPQADLDWQLTDLDKRTIVVLAKTVGSELARLNVARMQIDDWLLSDDGAWPPDAGRHHHHMGTTRMADDPKNGVVNRNCRVHGIDNLYVAGSSVFPTSGDTTPTLTIVALALRLADHFRNEHLL